MTKQPVQDALVERLRKPIDADKIYDWIVQKREETTSDLPRQGFQNEMELIDEERAEAAASIVIMQQTIAAHRGVAELESVRIGLDAAKQEIIMQSCGCYRRIDQIDPAEVLAQHRVDMPDPAILLCDRKNVQDMP